VIQQIPRTAVPPSAGIAHCSPAFRRFQGRPPSLLPHSRFDKPPSRGTLGVHLKNVLFVCTGNTCRSPLAEVLFRDLVKERSDYCVVSAGVTAFSGQPASRHSITLAKERGLDLTKHQSKAVTIDLVEAATHIFAMSRSHLAALFTDFPEAEEKLYLVSEFTADDALRGKDVADPYGGALADYRETLEHLQTMLPSLLAYIEQTSKAEAGRGSTQGD